MSQKMVTVLNSSTMIGPGLGSVITTRAEYRERGKMKEVEILVGKRKRLGRRERIELKLNWLRREQGGVRSITIREELRGE